MKRRTDGWKGGVILVKGGGSLEDGYGTEYSCDPTIGG